MQCLKIELYTVSAVTAVIMMVVVGLVLANRNQEKQENDPAG